MNQATTKSFKIDENHVRLAGTNTVYPNRSQPNPDFYEGLTGKSLRPSMVNALSFEHNSPEQLEKTPEGIHVILDSLPRLEYPRKILKDQSLSSCVHQYINL